MNDKQNSIFDSMDLLYLKECMRCGGHQELMKRWQVDDIDYANPHSSENLFFTKAVPRRYKWSRLAEIEALLSEGYIRTALISALIVADICSSIGGVSSDRKLEEWIEESIRKYELGCHGIDFRDKALPQNKSDLWTGKLCLVLRNNLVHGCSKDFNEVVNSAKTEYKKKYGYHYIDTVFTDGCMNRSIEFNCIKDKKRVKVLVFELSIPLLIMKIICAADVCYNENISGNEKYFSDGYEISEPTCPEFNRDDFFQEVYSGYKTFQVKDLFEKLDLGFKADRDFNSLTDVSENCSEEFDLPLVDGKIGNGIIYWGRSTDWGSAEMTLCIIQNGASAAGNVYVLPQTTGILSGAYLIRPLMPVSVHILRFLADSVQKSIKQHFGYSCGCTWDRVSRLPVHLPVTPDGQPDWAWMEQQMDKAVDKSEPNS